MIKKSRLIMLALAALLALPSAAQEKVNPKEKRETKTATTAEEAKAQTASDDPVYTIGAEDQLDIFVWKEPELSKNVPVRPDGKISLPLIADVQASGLTPMQLAMSITEKLKKFVNDPQVTVIVRQINSRRIYIVGEVKREGAFPMLPGMTVLQALSSAGGFSQFADLKGIYILRTEAGKQTKIPFNYKDAIKGLRPEQNVLLKPGDTVVVP